MTHESTGGVSKRSLLLLGGLAALALNKDTRRALVDGSRSAWSGTQETLTGTVTPALLDAAAHAREVALRGAHQVSDAVTHTAQAIKEEGLPRAGALLGSAVEGAGALAGTAQERATHLAGEAGQATRQVATRGGHKAQQVWQAAQAGAGHTLNDAQSAGRELLATVHDRVGHALHEAAEGAEARKRRAERTLRHARRDALKELQSGRKALKAHQLDKALAKRLAPLEKKLALELKVLEKQAKRARRDDHQGSGVGGGLVALALVGTGLVVLARVPSARQGILTAVEGVSPDAAEALRKAGRDARNLIGSAWLERIEEDKATPAPGAARTTQAATTGATWGGAVAPDAPAAAKTAAETEKADSGQKASSEKSDESKAAAPQPETQGKKSATPSN